MTGADCIFTAIGAVTLLGAFLAVFLRNVFYNALGLILALFGIASLFVYLDAEFLAVVEIIIYIGAISIAIIFAIMLSRPWFQQHTKRDPAKFSRALLSAALLFAGLMGLLRKTNWPSAPNGDISIAGIGRALLTTYALPFEAVSVVLLMAIIGALLISGSKEGS